jgi:uncharacterized protein (TIGR02284 family)
MEPLTNRTLETLESLVKQHINRTETYERAADDTDVPSLRALFADRAAQSTRHAEMLSTELARHGGTAPERVSFAGILQQSWMEFKAGLSGDSPKVLLESCQQADEAVQTAYRDALADEAVSWPAATRSLLVGQLAELGESHTQLQQMVAS